MGPFRTAPPELQVDRDIAVAPAPPMPQSSEEVYERCRDLAAKRRDAADRWQRANKEAQEWRQQHEALEAALRQGLQDLEHALREGR